MIHIYALLFRAFHIIVIGYCCNRLSFAAQIGSGSLVQLFLVNRFTEVPRA
jgi:hypothetical protein